MLATRKLFGIADPLTVRSPGLAELGWAKATEVVSGHQVRGGFVQVDVPQVQSLVGVCNLLAVGRPRGFGKERRWISQADVPNLAQTILTADLQVVFPRLIAEVCDRFAVGRPRGIAISPRGAVGQIADIAFVGGHGEYLSPRLEDRARARG